MFQEAASIAEIIGDSSDGEESGVFREGFWGSDLFWEFFQLHPYKFFFSKTPSSKNF